MTEGKGQLDHPTPHEITLTRLEETPVSVPRKTWLPLTQIAAWILFARISRKRDPGRSALWGAAAGFAQMAVVLGSEWGHNLAHLALSNWIGKPMDDFRIQFGMPRCVYHQLNDREVSPRQHILRALGGPLFNLLAIPFAAVGTRLTRARTLAGKAARAALHTNLFLFVISLLPIPGIDGGPILKWSLVQRGHSIPDADEMVRKVNGPLAVLLGLFSSRAFMRKNLLLGFFSALLGAASLGIWAGWIKEEDLNT